MLFRSEIERVDRGLIWTGGVQLGLVSAIPLPTALLAEHFTGEGSATAFFLYGVTFLLIATSFWAVSRTVLRRGLLRTDGDREMLDRLRRAYLVAIAWNVLCLLALSLSLFVALPMWAVMFAVFAFPGEFANRLHDLFVASTRPATPVDAG